MKVSKKIYDMLPKWLIKLLHIECENNPTPTPTPTPIPEGILKGYGMVNMWLDLSEFDSFMKLLKDNNCNCTFVELFGREEDGWINKQDTVKSQFTKLLTSAKKYGITIFVDIVNQGSGSLTSQSDTWFQGYLDFIKSFGSSNLIVQAVGEGSGSKSQNWYTMMEKTLSGFTLSYNMGSRPSTASSLYKYIDYHSTTLTDLGSSDKRIICNTDSGILNSMMNDGVLGQTFKTDQVTTFATGAINAGKSVNLYGYYHKTPDTAAIQTLGKIGSVIPDPVPSTDPDLTKATWQGHFKGPNSKQTVTAKNLNITSGSDNISMDWTTHTWPSGDGMCDGYICCTWKMNDKWYAAYLDYCPKGRTGYTWDCLKNMANSDYSPKPTKGTECGFFIMSEGLAERSNILMAKWPL